MGRQRSTRIGWVLLLGAALAGGGALAQVAPGHALPQAAGVQYLNGGVGKEQADRMRGLSSQYPVRMTFSEHNQGQDEFVADVHLRIVDSTGRMVLDLASQGPIFLLRVPDGAYSVEAEHQGEVKTRRFEVAAGRHENLVFSWS